MFCMSTSSLSSGDSASLSTFCARMTSTLVRLVQAIENQRWVYNAKIGLFAGIGT